MPRSYKKLALGEALATGFIGLLEAAIHPGRLLLIGEWNLGGAYHTLPAVVDSRDSFNTIMVISRMLATSAIKSGLFDWKVTSGRVGVYKLSREGRAVHKDIVDRMFALNEKVRDLEQSIEGLMANGYTPPEVICIDKSISCQANYFLQSFLKHYGEVVTFENCEQSYFFFNGYYVSHSRYEQHLIELRKAGYKFDNIWGIGWRLIEMPERMIALREKATEPVPPSGQPELIAGHRDLVSS
jgi:hypothetical protein